MQYIVASREILEDVTLTTWAIGGVKLHIPSGLPCLKSVKVPQAVVCHCTCSLSLSSVREMAVSSAKRCTCEMMVIDVDQENDRTQHSALGDSGCDWDSRPQQCPSVDCY